MIDESSIVALMATQLCATAQRIAIERHAAQVQAAGPKKPPVPPFHVYTPSEFIGEAEHVLAAVRKARGCSTNAPWEVR